MTSGHYRFLEGGGEMGALIREHDWTSTPLGEPGNWPQTLKTCLRVMLSTGHPMLIWWGEELIQFYNDAYRRSIGPERHPSALGQRGRECWDEIWDIIGPQIASVMAGKGYTWHENALVPITRYGKHEDVYWTYSYSPIDNPDAPNRIGGILVICTETTEQVLTEQRMRVADQRKDEFLAMLGHELRNPLSPILSTSELLQFSDCHPEAQELGALLLRQVNQLTHLVDDLLDVSRISRNRIELRRETFDLREAIELALEAVQPKLQAKNHDLHKSLPDSPVYVSIDSTRIVQCITNILHNASKFTPEGGRVELELSRQDGSALARISDNGVGMEEDTIRDAFELFYQNDCALDRSAGGLGIGLSLAQRLIHMHSGSISAISDGKGKGTTIEFLLPIVDNPSETDAAGDAGRIAPKQILIVDDNVDAANVLARLLTAEGHFCEAVYHAHQAIERLKTFEPDIVLLDIGLPEINGYDLGSKIRNDFPGMSLIAVTGYGQDRDVQRALDAGFDAHLTKPVDRDRIRRLVNAA